MAKSVSSPVFTVKHFREYLKHASGRPGKKLAPYTKIIILYPNNRVEVILKFDVSSNNDECV